MNNRKKYISFETYVILIINLRNPIFILEPDSGSTFRGDVAGKLELLASLVSV